MLGNGAGVLQHQPRQCRRNSARRTTPGAAQWRACGK
jgi:hypothetical protein